MTDRRARAWVAVGLAVLAAAVGLYWLLRERAQALPSEKPNAAADSSQPARRAGATRAPSSSRPRLEMPAPAIAPVSIPEACAHGSSAKSEWWDCLPHSAAWDATRAKFLLDRLAKYSDLHIAPERIECRTRCCKLYVARADYRAHRDELMSAVGIRIGPTDGYVSQPAVRDDPDGDIEVTTCWRSGDLDGYPDRAVEREELLARTSGELAACGKGLAEPTTVSLLIELDESGKVEDVKPSGGPPELECVEAALRAAAAFQPQPDTMAREVPVHVRLGPAS